MGFFISKFSFNFFISDEILEKFNLINWLNHKIDRNEQKHWYDCKVIKLVTLKPLYILFLIHKSKDIRGKGGMLNVVGINTALI